MAFGADAVGFRPAGIGIGRGFVVGSSVPQVRVTASRKACGDGVEVVGGEAVGSAGAEVMACADVGTVEIGG